MSPRFFKELATEVAFGLFCGSVDNIFSRVETAEENFEILPTSGRKLFQIDFKSPVFPEFCATLFIASMSFFELAGVFVNSV